MEIINLADIPSNFKSFVNRLNTELGSDPDWDGFLNRSRNLSTPNLFFNSYGNRRAPKLAASYWKYVHSRYNATYYDILVDPSPTT